jgi:hypothetical protein
MVSDEVIDASDPITERIYRPCRSELHEYSLVRGAISSHMPLDRNDWQDGEPRRSLHDRITELLEENPNKAFSADEIGDEIGFGNRLNQPIIQDRLVRIIVASMVDKLVHDGIADVRTVSGMRHYCISLS